MQSLCLESGLWTAPNWPKIWKMTMTPQFPNMMSTFNFFWHYFVSLVKFSYWSKFCVNIITSSGIMTISFYKVLTRNLKIRNTPIWVSPNIWRLGRVMDTKFGMNVSNRMLVNAAKFQGYSFYPTPPHPPPLILGLKEEKWKQQYSCIWQTFRSSHQEELCWKVILKKFIKFSP